MGRQSSQGPAGRDSDESRILVLAIVLLTAIFIAGLALPPTVATSGLYVVPVLITAWAARPRLAWQVAGASAVLALLGLAARFTLHAGEPDVMMAVGNTAISLFALWATAHLAHLRRDVERDLDRSRQTTATTLDNLREGVITTDGAGVVQLFNRAAGELLESTAEEAEGRELEDVLLLTAQPRRTAESTERPSPATGTRTRIRRPDGTELPVELACSSLRDGAGHPIGSVTVLRDVRAQEAYEEAIRKLAYRDELTGLPNRTSLFDRLELELAHARRNRSRLALLFIDLDGFKAVNDSLGHNAGDQLLVGIARRLVECLRDGDTVARLGGDEFTVVLPGVGNVPTAELVAEKIRASLKHPFVIDDVLQPIGCSIGIALYPEHGAEPEELLRHADGRMYADKRATRETRTTRAAERSMPLAPTPEPSA